MASLFFCAALLLVVLPFGAALNEDQLREFDAALIESREQHLPVALVSCYVSEYVSSVQLLDAGAYPRRFHLVWRQHFDAMLWRTFVTSLRHQRLSTASQNKRADRLANMTHL